MPRGTRGGRSEGPRLTQMDLRQTAPIYSAKTRAGLADLARAGLAGQMEADVMLERAVALDSGCMPLGMRLYALELCSVY